MRNESHIYYLRPIRPTLLIKKNTEIYNMHLYLFFQTPARFVSSSIKLMDPYLNVVQLAVNEIISKVIGKCLEGDMDSKQLAGFKESKLYLSLGGSLSQALFNFIQHGEFDGKKIVNDAESFQKLLLRRASDIAFDLQAQQPQKKLSKEINAVLTKQIIKQMDAILKLPFILDNRERIIQNIPAFRFL